VAPQAYRRQRRRYIVNSEVQFIQEEPQGSGDTEIRRPT
jgi:hypothetical protein